MSLIEEIKRTKKLLFCGWGNPQIKDGVYRLEYEDYTEDYHGRGSTSTSYKEISKEQYDFYVKLNELEELSKTITGTMYDYKGKTLWEIEASLVRNKITKDIERYYEFSVKKQPKYL